MFNNTVYSGAEGSLTVSLPVGLDQETLTAYLGENGEVGRVTGVTIHVSTVVRPFHELGSHAAAQLRAGNINVTGTVERAHINGAMLRLMLGRYAAEEEGTSPFPVPSFTLTVGLEDLDHEGDAGNTALVLYNVMFDSWQFTLPEDDFVMERLSFRARRLAVTDHEAGA